MESEQLRLGDFEMSMISEQAKKIRSVAGICAIEVKKTLLEAADTIEALSAKLAAANMENVGGWIACEDRLPEEEKYYLVTIINWEKKPAIEYCLFQNEKWYIVADGSTEENTTWKEEINSVIAWQPLPEPYRP